MNVAQPHDVLGTLVSPGDLLTTARGELLTALETPPSIWLRGAGIAVEDRKGVKTYRPASMLLKLDASATPDQLSVDRLKSFWAVRTATFQEQRRAELRARKGFKHSER